MVSLSRKQYPVFIAVLNLEKAASTFHPGVAFTQDLLQLSDNIRNLTWGAGVFFHSYLEAKEFVTAVFHISLLYICASITVLSKFPFSRI